MKPIQKHKPEQTTHRWKIVKGDLVKVIQGAEQGQQGRVLHVLRDNNRIIIEGVKMVNLVMITTVF